MTLRPIPLFAAALLVFTFACSTQKTQRSGWLCREHGIHRSTDRAEFAACFRISPDAIGNHYIFEKEATVKTAADVEAAAARMKENVADEIVDLIMNRLEAAYGSELTAHWRLESIDIDIPFRRFVLAGEGSFKVKVIALLKKEDLSPRALIRFLPLEYKMNLVEPTSREKREFRNLPVR